MMKMTRSFLFAALIVSTILADNCSAQKVPVSLQAPIVAGDQTGLRFSTALSDEIQLSGKFTLWTGKPAQLPNHGIRIIVTSIQVLMSNGDDVGSAIFVQATRESGKDPGYWKLLSAQMWMISKDNSVSDQSRNFLASVSRALE